MALLAIGDLGLTSQVARAFEEAELLPVLAFSRQRALRALDVRRFPVAVVHVGLPGELPMPEFVRSVRSRGRPAVLVVGESDRLAALLLEGSLHECVPVDTPPEEVAARAVALLTLRGGAGPACPLRWGALIIDPRSREAAWQGTPLCLTSIEFQLMQALANARGALVTVEELSTIVWGPSLPSDRERIFAHVRRIRKKIEPSTSHPRFLLTVRGEGFRLASTHGSRAEPQRAPRSPVGISSVNRRSRVLRPRRGRG